MAQSPEMRASDVDRDRVAAVLREHTAEGRITVDEFNERLEDVYKAKTYGELARVTADLPDVDMRARPARTPAPIANKEPHTGMRAAWAAWAAASAVNWVIWLIISLSTGDFIYPWPLWVMGPWGAILLVSTLFGTGPQKR